MGRRRRANFARDHVWLGVCVAGFVLAACQASYSSYFDQPGPNGEGEPATPGTHVVAGVGGPLEIHPGDRIQLLGVDTGSPDVSRVLVSVTSRMHEGFIGTARLPEMSPADLDGYEPLANQVFSSTDGAIAILLEIVVPDHDITILTPVLRFSVNSGPAQQERLMTNVRICSRASELDDCPTIDPPT